MGYRNFVISMFLVFILALLSVKMFSLPPVVTKEFLLYIIILVTASTILFSLRYEPVRALRGQYLRISFFFLVGFFIVHFQIYVDYVLDNYRDFGHDYFISKQHVPKASIISAIAMVGYYMGYILMTSRMVRYRRKQHIEEFSKFYPPGGVFFLIIVFFALMLLTADLKYFAGSYGDLSIGFVASYAQEYLIYAIIGYIVIKAYNMKVLEIRVSSFFKYIKRFPLSFLVIVFVYLTLVIVSGDRGPILQISISMVFSYIWVSQKKVRLPIIIGIIALGGFIVSLLGFVRAIDTGSGDFVDKVGAARAKQEKSSFSSSVSPATMELAVSVRTMHGAVEYTEYHGHTYGVFQGFQLVGTLPGVGILIKAFTGLGQDDLKSSGFITKHLAGKDYDHGLGTTAVADVYLDFGALGVLIGFLLFGCFIYYLESRMMSGSIPNLFVVVLFFTFMSKSIYIGRSTIMVLFREAILAFLVLMIAMLISSIFFKKAYKAS